MGTVTGTARQTGIANELILDTRSGMSHNETNNNERWEQMNSSSSETELVTVPVREAMHHDWKSRGILDAVQVVSARRYGRGWRYMVRGTRAQIEGLIFDAEYQMGPQMEPTAWWRNQCRTFIREAGLVLNGGK